MTARVLAAVRPVTYYHVYIDICPILGYMKFILLV
jgi:hypothetical protein